MAPSRPDDGVDVRAALLRHRDGDPEAFGELVARYRRPVYSYLVRCGVSPGDRDDPFQAVFLRIHRSVAHYRPELPAHPWIFTVVANEVRTHFRRRRVRELIFGSPTFSREPRDLQPDAERVAAARERLSWLEGGEALTTGDWWAGWDSVVAGMTR